MTSKESKSVESLDRILSSRSSKNSKSSDLPSLSLSAERLSELSARLPPTVEIKSLRSRNGEDLFLQVNKSPGRTTLYRISILPISFESGLTETFRYSYSEE